MFRYKNGSNGIETAKQKANVASKVQTEVAMIKSHETRYTKN